MAVKILDWYAFMTFFQDEPGAQLVEDLILQAQEGEIDLAMCVVNLGEVYYSIARTKSLDDAEAYIQQIEGMPIEIVEADWELTRQAALYKTKGSISYADCFAAALTKLRKGELVTGDKEFKPLDGEIKITWLK